MLCWNGWGCTQHCIPHLYRMFTVSTSQYFNINRMTRTWTWWHRSKGLSPASLDWLWFEVNKIHQCFGSAGHSIWWNRGCLDCAQMRCICLQSSLEGHSCRYDSVLSFIEKMITRPFLQILKFTKLISCDLLQWQPQWHLQCLSIHKVKTLYTQMGMFVLVEYSLTEAKDYPYHHWHWLFHHPTYWWWSGLSLSDSQVDLQWKAFLWHYSLLGFITNTRDTSLRS